MKFLFTFLLLIFASILYAQPGTVDKSYGTANTGIVNISNNFAISSLTIQPDNKLILGGSGSATGQLVVVRHNVDGSPDTSFGEGGKASVDIIGLFQNIRSVSGCNGIAVQPDGKIVAIGSVGYNNKEDNIFFDNDIVVARYLPNGTPDENFGSHGRVATELGYIETANAIALQEDGKIVVAGQQTTDINGNGSGVLLVRYNIDGSLDNSFGEGKGYVKYTNINRESSQANALLIQPDGKIVAGGFADVLSSFFIVRYLANGTLDAEFGNGGTVKTTSPLYEYGTQIKSLALDYKGRIIAAGDISFNIGVAILRYMSDGSPDKTFDIDGQLQMNFNGIPHVSANVSTVLAQPDGKLVISSTIVNNTTEYTIMPVLSGLNEDGSTDSSFGSNAGQTIINTGSTNDINALATTQSDGKIIVSDNNANYVTSTYSYLLTRFNGYPIHAPLYVRIKRWLQNHTLSWKGLPAEDKIAYYSVEQSSNSKGFTQVAKVSGVSNLKDYNITNSSLLQGTNYYRIKAVSTDGVIRYSEIVSADNNVNTASVFPNPAKSYITVQGLKTNETASISIKDGSGTVLSQGVSAGSTQYRSSLGSNMQPGTYYINITTATKTETLKFVKE